MKNLVLISSMALAALVVSSPASAHGVNPRCSLIVTAMLAPKAIYTNAKQLFIDLSRQQPDQDGATFIAMIGFMAVESNGIRQFFYWQVPLTSQRPLLGVLNNHQAVSDALKLQDKDTQFIYGGSFRMMISGDEGNLKSRIKFVQMTTTMKVFDINTFTRGHLVSALKSLQSFQIGLDDSQAFDIGWTGFSEIRDGRPFIPQMSIRDLFAQFQPE